MEEIKKISLEELENVSGGEGEEDDGPMYLEGTVVIPYKQHGTKEEVGVQLENGEVILCELYPSMKKGEILSGTRVRLRKIGWKYPYMVVKLYD